MAEGGGGSPADGGPPAWLIGNRHPDDMCIMPRCALFEAAEAVLGGAEPDRGEIEAAIAGAQGVPGRIPVGGE